MRFLTAQPVFYLPDTSAVFFSGISFTDIYRESSPINSFTSSQQELLLGYSFPQSGRFFGRISLIRSGYLASYQKQGDISSFRTETVHQKLRGDLSYSLSGFLLQPSLSLHQLKNRYSFSYSFTLALRPERGVQPPLWMHLFTRNEPALIEATAADQYISLPVLHAESGSRAGGSIPLFAGFALEGIYRKGYPEKTPEEDEFNGVLALSSEQYDAALVHKSKIMKSGIRYAEYRGEGKFDAYYTGLSFSSITVSRLRYHSWEVFTTFPAGKHHLITANLAHYSARGRASGNIQSWPFSTFFISVFGNRVNTILQGSAELFTAAVSDDFTTSSVRIIPLIRYYDIRPSFTAETWQPAFLVFGIKDYKRNELIISRAGAILLASDFYWDYKSWKFSAGLGQLIPVYITKRQITGTGAPPAGPGVKVKSDGARWVNFTANYYF